MKEVFSEGYAAAYDAIYNEKDYAGECKSVAKLIERHGDGRIRSLLDLGCGTGRHALHLVRRGFEVTGVDRSQAMLDRARSRAKDENLSDNLEFVCGDIRSFRSGRQFDAVLMNFNVLGYMFNDDDVTAALETARSNVRSGGLFIADFWYGPAVVADPPRHSIREIDTPGGRLIRSSSGRHLSDLQGCEITISVAHLEAGKEIEKSQEIHRVHYFFPSELEAKLRGAGFRPLEITGFPDIDVAANDGSWIAAVVAKAIEPPSTQFGSR
jgi:SAM-dependent methyltransferase